MAFNDYYLLVLLPLAVISGWAAARLDQRRQAARTSLRLPNAYFKGLNYLLNEEPDKAIEIFTQVLEVNTDTVETHLALGNLFRKCGEVERAIRLHQNLIARPSLDANQRAQALLELGQDYLKAGVFDRAENIFTELAEHRLYNVAALRQLLHIYQFEKEWERAIDTARRLARISGRPMGEAIAQYYCEIGEQALARKDYGAARTALRQALANDESCVRASIALGEVEAQQGNHRDAIKAWRRVEDQDAIFFGEVAGRIAASFRALGDEAGLFRFFDGASKRHDTVPMMLTLADIIHQRYGAKPAEKFVVDWLRSKPSVHGLHRLIDLNIRKTPQKDNADLLLLRGIIEQLKLEHEGYTCQVCGFKGRALHWSCPGCHQWNTVRPLTEH